MTGDALDLVNDQLLRQVSAKVQAWIEQAPVDGTEEALAALRAERERRLRDIDDAMRHIAQLESSIYKLEDALSIRERYLPQRDEAEPNGVAPSRGRAAVLKLFSQNPADREWTIPEVVRELAAKGWAEPGDDHAVGVSLSRLARAGKVRRPRKGVYLALDERVPEFYAGGNFELARRAHASENGEP